MLKTTALCIAQHACSTICTKILNGQLPGCLSASSRQHRLSPRAREHDVLRQTEEYEHLTCSILMDHWYNTSERRQSQ